MVCAQEHNGVVVSTFSPQHEGSGVDSVSLCQVCMFFSCLLAETCTLVSHSEVWVCSNLSRVYFHLSPSGTSTHATLIRSKWHRRWIDFFSLPEPPLYHHLLLDNTHGSQLYNPSMILNALLLPPAVQKERVRTPMLHPHRSPVWPLTRAAVWNLTE